MCECDVNKNFITVAVGIQVGTLTISNWTTSSVKHVMITDQYPLDLQYIKMRVQGIQKYLSILISLSCASFVLYQGYKCWTKYKAIPKTTHVSIEKATRYPDVTFCSSVDFFRRNNDCNISAHSYFTQNQWTGTLNCSDPIKLHNSLVGDVKDLVWSIVISGDDVDVSDIISVDLEDPSNFRVLDLPNGRCYSIQWTNDFDMTWIDIEFLNQTYVSINAPGNFLGNSDKATIRLIPNSYTRVKVLYETFKVLSFDGEICENDKEYKRDNCMYSAIQEVIQS